MALRIPHVAERFVKPRIHPYSPAKELLDV
jgi:hypothetical protein